MELLPYLSSMTRRLGELRGTGRLLEPLRRHYATKYRGRPDANQGEVTVFAAKRLTSGRVLLGAEGAIARLRPRILIEVNEATCAPAGYSRRDLLGLLERFGYRFSLVERHGRLASVATGNVPEFCNVLCEFPA